MRELERLVRATQDLAKTFDLAVIGGISLGAWTAPRNTSDVDILIDSTDFEAIEAAGCQVGLCTDPTEVTAMRTSGMTRLRLPDFRNGRVRILVIGPTTADAAHAEGLPVHGIASPYRMDALLELV